jgi:hypothetical protein
MRVYACLITAAAALFTQQVTDPYCKTGIISNEIVGPGPEPHRYGCCPTTCKVCFNTDRQCEEYMKQNAESDKKGGGMSSEACCGSRIVGSSAEDFETCKQGAALGWADGKRSTTKSGATHIYRKDYCRHIKKSAKTASDTHEGGSGDTMFFPDCSNGVPPCVLTSKFHKFLKSVKAAENAEDLKGKFDNKKFYKDCDKENKSHETHIVESRTIGATSEVEKQCTDLIAKSPCDGDAPTVAMAHEMWQQCCAHKDGRAEGKTKVDKLKR